MSLAEAAHLHETDIHVGRCYLGGGDLEWSVPRVADECQHLAFVLCSKIVHCRRTTVLLFLALLAANVLFCT